MRFLLALLTLPCAFAQTGFTLDQVMSAAFPSELTASPSGAKAAWVSYVQGVRNILVAEPPAYRARKITGYTEDDGQELLELRWTPDASAVVYVRGGSGEAPNPAMNPAGAGEDIWIAPLDGGAPRKIGEGHSPAISPKGDRVAFARRGALWWAPLDGKSSPEQMFKARGTEGRPTWSPDGARVAFTSARGDHGFIGVYELAANTLRYLDPGTDNDREPEWSPDSRNVAWIRVPSSGQRSPREAQSGTASSIWARLRCSVPISSVVLSSQRVPLGDAMRILSRVASARA
jgi:Tol biopolymer transport system component